MIYSHARAVYTMGVTTMLRLGVAIARLSFESVVINQDHCIGKTTIRRKLVLHNN